MKRHHYEYTLPLDLKHLANELQWQGAPLKRYKALYRSNNGVIKFEQIFRAPSIEDAEKTARAAIIQPKKRDKFWMVLYRVTEIPPQGE